MFYSRHIFNADSEQKTLAVFKAQHRMLKSYYMKTVHRVKIVLVR